MKAASASERISATSFPQLKNSESFIKSIDMQGLSITIVRSEKKVFKDTMYIFQSQIPDIPYLGEIGHSYNEVLAFYEALKMKFKGHKFPEFPSSSGFKASATETRIKAFQNIVDDVLYQIQTYPEMVRDMAPMIFNFIIKESKTVVKERRKSDVKSPDVSNSMNHSLTEIDNFQRDRILQRSETVYLSSAPSLPNEEPMGKRKASHDGYLEFEKLEDCPTKDPAQVKIYIEDDSMLISSLKADDQQKPLTVRERVKSDQGGNEIEYKSAEDSKSAKSDKQPVLSKSKTISTEEEKKSFSPDVNKKPQKQLYGGQEISDETIGYAWAKLPHSDQFKQYFIRYSNSQLMFCQNVKKVDFLCTFVIFRSVIRWTTCNFGFNLHHEALIITHKYDNKCLYLTHQNDDTLRQIYAHIFKNSAQNLSEQMMPVDFTNRMSNGKLFIEIDSIEHLDYQGNIYVKISCNPFILISKRIVDGVYQFHQRFYLPINNHFNTLKIEVINISNTGWLKDSKKEFALASFDIRVPDIEEAPFKQDGKVKLIINEEIDYKKIGMKKVGTLEENTVKVKKPFLAMRVVDMTRIDSHPVKNPNREIVEDRKKRQGYSYKEIQTVMTRSKLVIAMLNWLKQLDRPVVYFDYPRYSKAWYCILVLVDYFFNPIYLLTYITIFSFVLIGAHSEEWAKYGSPLMEKYFFSNDQLNPLIKDNHVKTKDQISADNCYNILRDAKEQLKSSQEEYHIKDKSLMNKFKDFKQGSTYTLNYLDQICDFFEKSKNLVKWDDKRMTRYFFLFVIVAFVIVTFIPLRFFIFFYLTYKFYKGQYYHAKRVRNNQEVCRIELVHFLEDNKIYYPNFDDPWPLNVKNFERRLTLYFQEALKIYLPKNVLSLCETGLQLIEMVGYTANVIELPLDDRNEVELENNPKLYRRSTAAYMYVWFFLMNRIPSDIYRIKNPKFVNSKQNNALNSQNEQGISSADHSMSVDVRNLDETIEEQSEELKKNK